MSLKRRLIPALAAAGLLVAVILGHQRRFEARCQAFPRPGLMVTAPGGLVHVRCEGNGYPLVLLEASGLGSAAEYEAVLHRVARRTTACAWDRPGMGWSPATLGGTSVPEQGERILAALGNMGRRGPLVAVGASSGGLISQYLARQHPERVIGLVLLDALSPEAVQALEAPLAELASTSRAAALEGRFGLLSLLDPLRLSDESACLIYWPEVFDASAALLSDLSESARLVSRCPALRRNLPLVVLRHGHADDSAADAFARPKVPEGTWLAFQQRLAAQSSAGRLRVVPRSGPMIAIDQPDAVVQAIDDVLDETEPTDVVRFGSCGPRKAMSDRSPR